MCKCKNVRRIQSASIYTYTSTIQAVSYINEGLAVNYVSFISTSLAYTSYIAKHKKVKLVVLISYVEMV